MNRHIAADAEVAADRRENGKVRLIEGTKESTLLIEGAAGQIGREVFNKDLLVRTDIAGGTDNQPAGGVENPDFRAGVGGDGAQLAARRVQGNLRVVEVRGVGVRDLRRLPVQIFTGLPAHLVRGHVGDKRSHDQESEEPEEKITDDEL